MCDFDPLSIFLLKVKENVSDALKVSDTLPQINKQMQEMWKRLYKTHERNKEMHERLYKTHKATRLSTKFCE